MEIDIKDEPISPKPFDLSMDTSSVPTPLLCIIKKEEPTYNCLQCSARFECIIDLEHHQYLHLPTSNMVDRLLQQPFSTLESTECIKIKAIGRPTPTLNERLQFTSMYNKYPWLTAAISDQRFYCWPCLLYPISSRNHWSIDVENCSDDFFVNSSHNHVISAEHIQSEIKLKLLGVTVKRSANGNAVPNDYGLHNRRVKKNLQFLKSLINVTETLLWKNISFLSSDPDHFVNIDLLQRTFDFLLMDRDNLIQLFTVAQLNTIQRDLIKSMRTTIVSRIVAALDSVPFYSWQIDGIPNVSTYTQLSIIVRYCVHDKITERFIGLYDLGERFRDAETVWNCVDSVMGKFNYRKKLVAHSMDSSVLSLSELRIFLDKMRHVAPQALYLKSHEHSVKYHFCNATNGIVAARTYVSDVSGFYDFFSKSDRSMRILASFKSADPKSWNFTSLALPFIDAEQKSIFAALEVIQRSPSVDIGSLQQCHGLLDTLSSVEFRLLTKVFLKIFSRADIISSILTCNVAPIYMCDYLLEQQAEKLRKLKTEKEFRDLLTDMAVNYDGKESVHFDDNFCKLYYNIIDVIVEAAELLCADYGKLSFVNLLTMEMSHDKRADKYSAAAVECIEQNFSQYFDVAKLKGELEIFRIKYVKLRQTPNELLTDIIGHKLDEKVFQELTKMLQLIVTLPPSIKLAKFMPLSSESTFRRLKEYGQSIGGEERNTSMALFHVEREFVEELHRNTNWHNDIIENFVKITCLQEDFVYKIKS